MKKGKPGSCNRTNEKKGTASRPGTGEPQLFYLLREEDQFPTLALSAAAYRLTSGTETTPNGNFEGGTCVHMVSNMK